MTFPEKAPMVALAASCLGNCAACGRCPFAENLRKGSTLPGRIISLTGYKAEKTSKHQSVVSAPSVIAGRPVLEFQKKAGCTDCKDGSCQKCLRAA